MAKTRPSQFSVEIDADELIAGGADSGDAGLAVRIVKAAAELQAAMDAAASAGLMLEPTLQRSAGQAADDGGGGASDADSIVCKVEIFRKLV